MTEKFVGYLSASPTGSPSVMTKMLEFPGRHKFAQVAKSIKMMFLHCNLISFL